MLYIYKIAIKLHKQSSILYIDVSNHRLHTDLDSSDEYNNSPLSAVKSFANHVSMSCSLFGQFFQLFF